MRKQIDFNKPTDECGNRLIDGCELILSFEELITQRIPKNSNFIEIGSQNGHNSTEILAKMCKKINLKFTTVDISERIYNETCKILNDIDINFLAVNDYGERFLQNFEESIHILYLDAFDYEANHHSTQKRNEYKERGYDITIENCHKMHLDCAIAIKDKMPSGSFIFFDDVYYSTPDWTGKGETAIPYLLNNGFKILKFKANGLALIKE